MHTRRYLGDVIDFVIAVGGDGTILHVSSLFEKEVPPILSFSMGTLGFLMPFRIDDYKEALRLVMKVRAHTHTHTLNSYLCS